MHAVVEWNLSRKVNQVEFLLAAGLNGGGGFADVEGELTVAFRQRHRSLAGAGLAAGTPAGEGVLSLADVRGDARVLGASSRVACQHIPELLEK